MTYGATAGEQPCEMYVDHRPAVIRTQHHHSHPQYLQLRLWGEVRDGPDTWVCGNCHDAIHESWKPWAAVVLALATAAGVYAAPPNVPATQPV